MQLKECYDKFGGSYEDIKSRLSNDDLIQRLVIKFPADPNYEKLCDAFENRIMRMLLRRLIQ